MVEKLKAEYRIDLEWRPFYLYRDLPPEGMDIPDHIKRARSAGSEEHLSQIAKLNGMPFVSTERIYNTRLAHEATEYAREHGMGNEFHGVVFRKVYAEGCDISQWDVLRAAALEVGLNPDEMQGDVESGRRSGTGRASLCRRCDRRTHLRDQQSLCHRRCSAL